MLKKNFSKYKWLWLFFIVFALILHTVFTPTTTTKDETDMLDTFKKEMKAQLLLITDRLNIVEDDTLIASDALWEWVEGLEGRLTIVEKDFARKSGINFINKKVAAVDDRLKSVLKCNSWLNLDCEGGGKQKTRQAK